MGVHRFMGCAVARLRSVAEPVGDELPTHLLRRDLCIHHEVGESLWFAMQMTVCRTVTDSR